MSRWWVIALLGLPLVACACGQSECFQFIGAAGPRPVLLNRCTGAVTLGEAPALPPAQPSTPTTSLPKTEV